MKHLLWFLVGLLCVPSALSQPADTLDPAVYPDSGRTGSFSLYEDDGKTLNYQTGAYAVTELSQRLHSQNNGSADLSVTIGGAVGTYAGQPSARTIRMHVHRVPEMPDRVRMNGQALSERTRRTEGSGWRYDPPHTC